MTTRHSPLLLCLAVAAAQAHAGDLQTLVDRAANAKDTTTWAHYLIEADAAAEELQAEKPTGCCGYRCLHVGSFELHYRYNEIQGHENYQHDLLQIIALTHEGSREGAEALVRLLPTGCQTIASSWTPYFKTVLGILESPRWRALADPRLTRMRAEAYETWWSLSMVDKNDSVVADQGLSRQHFLDGAPQAKQRAIEAYQWLLKSNRPNTDIVNRLRKLEANQDTGQRQWLCEDD